jgi:hypothetical protein
VLLFYPDGKKDFKVPKRRGGAPPIITAIHYFPGHPALTGRGKENVAEGGEPEEGKPAPENQAGPSNAANGAGPCNAAFGAGLGDAANGAGPGHAANGAGPGDAADQAGPSDGEPGDAVCELQKLIFHGGEI